MVYVADAVTPHCKDPVPVISYPSGIGCWNRSQALDVAGVADRTCMIMGVDDVVTAPPVFSLKLNVVV